jgi:hypothetical protein
MIGKLKLVSVLALGSVFAAGCGDDEEDDFVASTDFSYVGYDATWADTCAAMNYAFMDPIDDVGFVTTDDVSAQIPPTTSDLAAMSAAGLRNYFTPSGCITATSAQAVVNVNLNNCTGPLGMRNVSGNFATTFSRVQNGLAMNVKATNVTINNRTAQWELNGTATRSGNNFSLGVTSNGTLTGTNALAIGRNAQATINWTKGSGCVAVDGQDTLTANGATFNGRLSGYQRCTGACPTAGTLFLDGPDQDITVTFNGTSTPPASSTTGATSELQLTCGG